MFKHGANNYSWYVIHKHDYIGSNLLAKINLNKKVQVRYDLKRGRFVVVRSSKIETNVDNKVKKTRKLQDKLLQFQSTNKKEVFDFLKINKQYILDILR